VADDTFGYIDAQMPFVICSKRDELLFNFDPVAGGCSDGCKDGRKDERKGECKHE
jgi:hypothetical protein